jgi:hypothetical protein
MVGRGEASGLRRCARARQSQSYEQFGWERVVAVNFVIEGRNAGDGAERGKEDDGD